MSDSNLFLQLAAFLRPAVEKAGYQLRPFSINLYSTLRLCGIQIGSEEFATLPPETKEKQIAALAVIQISAPGELKRAIIAANGDFEKFYLDFVFEKASEIPLEFLGDIEEQLTTELPAIAAGLVEVEIPPSLKSDGDKAPPNS